MIEKDPTPTNGNRIVRPGVTPGKLSRAIAALESKIDKRLDTVEARLDSIDTSVAKRTAIVIVALEVLRTLIDYLRELQS